MRDLSNLFGKHLREVRKARGLTQGELAHAANRSLEMIGKLERATVTPSFETIEALARVLKVPPIALFGVETRAAIRTTERGKQLAAIERLLSRANDAEVKRAAKLIATLFET